MEVLGHRPGRQLDGGPVERIGDARPGPSWPRHPARQSRDADGDGRVEDALQELERKQVRTEEREDTGCEEEVERRDRPMLIPGPPGVALEDVGERMWARRDVEGVREVRVLVLEEERLVDQEQERGSRCEGEEEDGHGPNRRAWGRGQSSNPPSTPTTAPLMKEARSEARKR